MPSVFRAGEQFVFPRPEPQITPTTIGAAIIVALLAGLGSISSGWAQVTPGPIPNITEAVVTQNHNRGGQHNLDPTFGQGTGGWYATTISATPLTGWGRLVAGVKGEKVLPLSKNTTKEQANAAMTRSVELAQTQAATRTPTPDYYPNLDVEMGEVGGTSAGLILTLAFIDARTTGDLTGGLRIAGTGTINDLGEVGAVTGVEFKSQAVAQGNFDVFFVPVYNADEIHPQLAQSTVEVVPVATLNEAVTWLCDRRGTSPICGT